MFKINKSNLKGGLRSPINFKIVTDTLKQYSKRFYIKVEQLNINHDHCHLLIRFSKRSQVQNFFRVSAGQIAQRFQNQNLIKATDTPTSQAKNLQKLWRYRPFTRVVKGRKSYQIIKDYIQLNEKEARGEITYKKDRLKGLSRQEYEGLWSS